MALHCPLLVPSLLAGNHASLAESANLVALCQLPWAHLDIMDGHFVPNLTFGPQTLADLRRTSDLFFDTHLMLDEPHLYIEAFAKAGAGLISIHVEPDYDIPASLQRIHRLGCQNGLVLNPGTPAEAAIPYLDQVDLILVMTVQPGYGGQAFRAEVLPKISALARWREQRGLHYRLEVDGGIDLRTGRQCWEAGADTFVAGTAFFRATDRPAFAKSFADLPRSH